MPPQSNSAVVDDEYGLEPAKPAAAGVTDDKYGLEPAGKSDKPAFSPGSFQQRKGGPVLNANTTGIQGQSKKEVTQNLKADATGGARVGPGPTPGRVASEAGLGAASGFSGMPESSTPLKDFGTGLKSQQDELLQHPVKTIAKNALFGPAPQLYEMGKGLVESGGEIGSGVIHADPEKVAHGGGRLVGQLAQIGALKEAPEAAGERPTTQPILNRVASAVREPATAKQSQVGQAGKLTPATKTVARVGGAALGHLAGVPGLGEFGGFIGGPALADAVLPKGELGTATNPGPFMDIPPRVPKASTVKPMTPLEPKIVQPGGDVSEGRPATWADSVVQTLAPFGDPDAIAQTRNRMKGPDPLNPGRAPLKYSTVETTPRSITKVGPNGEVTEVPVTPRAGGEPSGVPVLQPPVTAPTPSATVRRPLLLGKAPVPAGAPESASTAPLNFEQTIKVPSEAPIAPMKPPVAENVPRETIQPMEKLVGETPEGGEPEMERLRRNPPMPTREMSEAEKRAAEVKPKARTSPGEVVKPMQKASSRSTNKILFETDRHYITRGPKGFEVYENGPTAATRVAQIGYEGDKGLERAKQEIQKREAGSDVKSMQPRFNFDELTPAQRQKAVSSGVYKGQKLTTQELETLRTKK